MLGRPLAILVCIAELVDDCRGVDDVTYRLCDLSELERRPVNVELGSWKELSGVHWRLEHLLG